MSKFKVMFIVHSLGIGGVEKLVYDMVKELKNRDIEPSVCCLDYVGVWGEELKRDGFKVFNLERKEGLDLGILRKIKLILKKEHPDILHPHQYTPYFYTVASCFSLKRPRIVFTEHGRFFPDRIRIKRVIFNQFAQFFTDAIIGVCGFTKEALVKYEKFAQNRIEVVYNGIKIEEFSADIDAVLNKKTLQLNPDNRIIGTVGRLCIEKNHKMLIKAFAEVKKQISDVKLLIVGDGELRAELEALSQKMDLANDILFLGERQDVAELMKIFDVFVLSSDSEAASLVLLEAMASGTVIIATNVGGNPELVINGKTGILVQRGDYQGLSDSIVFIIQNPDIKKKMEEAERQLIYQKFNFINMLDKYMNIYSRILKR